MRKILAALAVAVLLAGCTPAKYPNYAKQHHTLHFWAALFELNEDGDWAPVRGQKISVRYEITGASMTVFSNMGHTQIYSVPLAVTTYNHDTAYFPGTHFTIKFTVSYFSRLRKNIGRELACRIEKDQHTDDHLLLVETDLVKITQANLGHVSTTCTYTE
jgi:hypothetical protein